MYSAIDRVIILFQKIDKHKHSKQRKNRFEIQDVKTKREFDNIKEIETVAEAF